jgi:hypothetical protein
VCRNIGCRRAGRQRADEASHAALVFAPECLAKGAACRGGHVFERSQRSVGKTAALLDAARGFRVGGPPQGDEADKRPEEDEAEGDRDDARSWRNQSEDAEPTCGGIEGRD